MDETLRCVLDTNYGDFFDDVSTNTVFMFSNEFSEHMWSRDIHQGSSSYFQLPDDNWIVTGKSQSIGHWIEPYNNGDNATVERLLRKNIDWPDDTVINFFARRKTVFQTKWRDFLCFWDDFLAIEDDCPILIPEGGSGKEALLFRAIGDILKIG